MFSPEDWTAILLSLKVAAVACAFSLPLGIAAAAALARFDFPGKTLLDALIHLPLVLPPVVTGYLLLLAFGRNGPLGRLTEQLFGLVLAFRWTGAALAAAVMGFPLLVRAVRLAIESVDPRLEQAAATLGKPPLVTFFRVTLPLAWGGVLAGTVLAFARALGEFGATITFVSNIPGETQTIPTAIYTYTQVPGGDANALRLSAVSIVLSLAALVASELLARRSRAIAGVLMLEFSARHRAGRFELDAAFTAGEGVTALFGHSGSGKSTVNNIIAGLIRPERGRVAVNGTVLTDTAAGVFVPPHRRGIGYVFQDDRLFPHLTVKANLLFGAADDRKLAQAAGLLGLDAFLGRHPRSLSGGEKQRVALGRALLSEPRLLLLDEPFAAIDRDRKDEVLPYLERVVAETRLPVLYVSHSHEEVARFAHHVVRMVEGRARAALTAAEFRREHMR